MKISALTAFLLVSLVAFSGCGSGSDGKNNGSNSSSSSSQEYDRCSTMINDWNSIVSEVDTARNALTNASAREALTRAKAACDQFWRNNTGVGPCSVRMNNQNVEKSADDMRSTCDGITNLLARYGA